MNKKFLMFLVGLILILGLSFFTLKIFNQDKRKVCYKDKCFNVELANNDAKRQGGLSGRGALADDDGMLFIFDTPGRYPFWMKDMFIPLDIIWIDTDGKVVFIKEDARPCKEETCDSFTPNGEAKYVLEINSGKVKNIGLKVGDKLKI